MHISFSATSDDSMPNDLIRDYEISKDVGISYQETTGRIPVTGRSLNKECQEVYFIIEGSAKFFVGNDVYDVREKDVIVVEPGIPHHHETTGLRFITITRPDWFPEQASIVD